MKFNSVSEEVSSGNKENGNLFSSLGVGYRDRHYFSKEIKSIEKGERTYTTYKIYERITLLSAILISSLALSLYLYFSENSRILVVVAFVLLLLSAFNLVGQLRELIRIRG